MRAGVSLIDECSCLASQLGRFVFVTGRGAQFGESSKGKEARYQKVSADAAEIEV